MTKSEQLITPRVLATVGEALYGEQWQNQLARSAGISQPMLSMMVSGDRPIINRDFVVRLARICNGRAADLTRYAAQLNTALAKE